VFRRFDCITFWICWLLSVCQCTAEELSSNRTGTGGEESVLGDEIIETREGASETVSRRKENCSDGGINQNQVRSRLHDLELELSSVLQSLKSNTGESESQEVVPKLCPWWTQMFKTRFYESFSLYSFFVYKKQMEFNVELSLYLFIACYKVMNQYKLIPCMNFVWLLLAPYLVSKAMHPLAF